jgi:mono/diheme cytochrome c family protein
MRIPASVVLLFSAAASATVLAAQIASKVDFQREVQPIFRRQCFECHGPDQQMNGFRLDRRADALRGAGQTNIGPGNAEGSRLYHRLIGAKFGMQMPPAGPLSASEIAIIKSWIDQGAEWPDDVADDRPFAPVDAEAQRLIMLIRSGERAAAERMVRDNPRVARMKGAGGSTPLMFAALYGDQDLMSRLLAAGADPGAANTVGATVLMWAVPDVDKLQLVLDLGVDVNARSDDRRSALDIAAGTIGAAPAVRLLLEYGATAVSLLSDFSPLREAARVDSPEAFAMILEYGADAKEDSAVSATFLRTNCFKCAQLAGLAGSGPLARVPPPNRGLRPVLPEAPAAARSQPARVASMTPAVIRAAVIAACR